MHDVSVVAVTGLQAGDEGKGAITYKLCGRAGADIRFNGGPNAGHRVYYEAGKSFSFHQLPSGMLYDISNVMELGMVVNPFLLNKELSDLRKEGLERGTLYINELAHLILPAYVMLDQGTDFRDKDKRTSTGTGIKWAYLMKAARLGMRMGDLVSRDEAVEKRVENNLAFLRPHLEGIGIGDRGFRELRDKTYAVFDEAMGFGEHITQPSKIRELYEDVLYGNKLILGEGAQGTLIDVDFGQYPAVTSSQCTARGIRSGSMISPKAEIKVLGVTKPYVTRAGTGALPTRMNGETEEWVRKRGGEHGTTTGLERMVGWLDLVQLKEAAEVNGVDWVALTKLDVLAGINPLRYCAGYEMNGKPVPYQYVNDVQEKVRPVYEDIPGFPEVEGATDFEELPSDAKRIVEMVEDEIGRPIVYIGTGKDPGQYILRGEGTNLFPKGQ
jgi:adenylosuccinate synthase